MTDRLDHPDLRALDLPVEASELRALAAALEGRDGFIARLGHELRNAVAPILLIAEQLRDLAGEPGAPAPLASRAGMLTRTLGRLVATIDRVAEVAELRRGAARFQLTAVDLADVVTDVCLAAKAEAHAGNAVLVVDAAAPVTGSWDRARLTQIVENLVANAIRYGGGGRIELTVRDRAGAGELTVRDHGPGLAPAMLAHVFDPLGPLDLAHNRRTGGFGVGLWIVKSLCTAMHGAVTVENDPSGGARFCVVLPRG